VGISPEPGLEKAMRKWRTILGAAAAVAMLSLGAAQAQDRSAAQQVADYLDTGMAPHAALGYAPEPSNMQVVQAIHTESAFLWLVYLRAGVHYRIYGACNDPCTDMDMEVYGADGVLADRDAATNDTPYVQISPITSGRHYVRLWIYACTQEPCTAGARVVSGGRLEPRPAEQTSSGDEENSDPTDIVKGELDDSAQAQTSAGYAPFGDDVIRAIAKRGDGYRQNLHLDAGRAYMFIGACDADCHDVDMEILDADGSQIASDTADDDRPAVGITPQRAGGYSVRIWLSDCAHDQCTIGLRSFRRDRAR